MLFKNLRRNIHKILHPRRVQVVHVDGTPVDEKIINGTSVYLAAYFILVVLSILLISIDNKPLVTNLSAVLSCFNNIGPGLEIVGPTGNFSSYSAFSKLVLIFDMLAGRLEIFPILALISRGAWKKAPEFVRELFCDLLCPPSRCTADCHLNKNERVTFVSSLPCLKSNRKCIYLGFVKP